MSDIEIKNAIIESARISADEHGLLDCWLMLDYGGVCQGFGGWALYLPKDFTHHDPSGPNYAGHFIWRVMEVAGVKEWSQLNGKTIRVKCASDKIYAIGHIVKNDWFEPDADFATMKRGIAA
jgi:hypothetical protein